MGKQSGFRSSWRMSWETEPPTTGASRFEIEPKVVANLLVFGSPQAQLAGQQVGSGPTTALASRFGGPERKNGATPPWKLAAVEAGRLILTYTGASAPAVPTGTYVCNLTPARAEEIFYRKVISASNDAASKRLTLVTVDVPLAEMITQGSAALSSGPSVGSLRVIRGGGWLNFAWFCRSSFRYGYAPEFRFNGFGFRPVLAPGQP